MTQRQATEQLGLTVRQVERLFRAFKADVRKARSGAATTPQRNGICARCSRRDLIRAHARSVASVAVGKAPGWQTNSRGVWPSPQCSSRVAVVALASTRATCPKKNGPDGVSRDEGSLQVVRLRSGRHTRCWWSVEVFVMANERYEDCIEACLDCATACERCATACLGEENVKAMAECVRLDRDCADACRLAATLVSRGSRFAAEFCALCASICDACAAECEKHEAAHCRACAEACRRCAAACRRMSTQTKGATSARQAHA